jgi:3-oxoacyl-[acyl-carrier protein] reductase
MDLKLTGKDALVTGSSRGIGLATAKAFATERCPVMLSGRSTEQLRQAETTLRATGAQVAAHAGDVDNPDQASRLIEATVAAYGGIDILVNTIRTIICGTATGTVTCSTSCSPTPAAVTTSRKASLLNAARCTAPTDRRR